NRSMSLRGRRPQAPAGGLSWAPNPEEVPMVKPIPDGYPQVIPYLSIDGASKAIDFYTTVFGAKERMRMDAPGGKIGHAELEIGGSLLMLADTFPEMGGQSPKSIGGTPVSIMTYV